MELHIREVSKSYSNGVQALRDVTLTIPVGMYGLLGPNGAGKSTLMRILATLQEPDEGSIRLGDIDVLNQKDEVRKTLGYLPQEFGVYPKATAENLLNHFAILKGHCRAWGAQRGRRGAPAADQPVGGTGSRNWVVTRVACASAFGFAVALLGHPKLMIVDEPTAGLDRA